MGQGVAWHAHKFMKKQDMCHGWHGPPHIFETWDGNMLFLKHGQHFAHYAYYV